MKKKREEAAASPAPNVESPPAAAPQPAAAEPPPATDAAGNVNLLAFADWVAQGAQRETAAAADPESAWVAFRLDDEEYGFPIASVREILRVEEITRVPQAPPFIRGVTNVRGKILPVVEIRTRLGLSPLVPDADSRVVVLEVGTRTLGLLVDGSVRVARIRASQVEPPPEEIVSARTDYVTGVAKRPEGLLILLEPEKTLVVKP